MTETTMTPEEQAAIAELDRVLAEHGAHPAVRNVLLLAQDVNGAWTTSFTAEQLTAMENGILEAEQHGTKSLIDCVASVIRLATFLGKEPAALKAAAMLVAVAEKVIHEKNLLAVMRKDAEFEPGRLAAAKDAVGASKAGAPAKVGAKPPEGTLRVDQITPGGKRRL